MSGVEAVAWMREGADSVLHNFRFRNPNGGPWIALYSQATVDTLRAQLEAALARAEAAEADAARLRVDCESLVSRWRPDMRDYPEAQQDCADQLQAVLDRSARTKEQQA